MRNIWSMWSMWSTSQAVALRQRPAQAPHTAGLQCVFRAGRGSAEPRDYWVPAEFESARRVACPIPAVRYVSGEARSSVMHPEACSTSALLEGAWRRVGCLERVSNGVGLLWTS